MMKAGELATTQFPQISPFAGTREIKDRLVGEKFFVVMDKKGFQGIVTATDCIHKPHKLVADCVRKKPKINYDDDIGHAMLMLKETNQSALPVFKGDDFYGVFSADAVFSFVSEKIMQGLCESSEDCIRASRILAAGLGHDFNNLLNIIIGGITVILRHEMDRGETVQALQNVERAALAAKNLSRQLLAFAKEDEPKREVVDLTKILEDAVSFYTAKSGVTTTFTIEGDALPVLVNLDQLHQVLGNLTVNAIQAMPDGGTLSFTLKRVSISEDNDLPLRAGQYAMLQVADDGMGIAKKYQKKIFDPKFTTKPEGSGLGLAIVYSVISRHDGHIMLESEEGQGARFTIYLPMADGSVTNSIVVETQFTPVAKKAERKKILVMDDNVDNLSLLQRFLPHLGHRVETASSSEKTLRLYQEALSAGDPFDGVLLDLILPDDAGGEQVMQSLRKIDPGAKGIITSGDSQHEIIVNYRAYGFSGAIAKPYRLDEMKNVLENL
ncbi:MAG: ATP-binding protein [Thermodesulfobacteriota bacterium]